MKVPIFNIFSKNKIVPFLLGTFSVAFSFSNLRAFTELGNGQLFLDNTFDITHDTNVTGNSSEVDDLIYSYTPTLRFSQQGSQSNVTASVGLNISRFDENSQFDRENLQSSISIGLPTGGRNLSGSINAGYTESSSTNNFLLERVDAESIRINTNARYDFSRILDLSGGLGYSDTTTTNFSDTEDKYLSTGVVFKNLWRDVGVNLDYRYRVLKSSGFIGEAADTTDSGISFGVDGSFLPDHLFPNLDAFLNFSIRDTNTGRMGESSSKKLGINASIVWNPRPRTTVSIALRKDSDLTPDDRTVENFTTSINLNQQIGQQLTANFSISNSDSDYLFTSTTRDILNLATGITYQTHSNWSFSARLSHQDSSSTQTLGNYSGLTTSISSTYTF